MTPEIRLSENREEMDDRWVISEIRSSYWGEWMTPIQIMRALDHSLCFGAFIDTRQIGFARVVTDRSTFSSITDMLVGERFRRQGVGRRLMLAVTAHRWVAPTICTLASRDARGFYAKFGFVEIGGDVMKRAPR